MEAKWEEWEEREVKEEECGDLPWKAEGGGEVKEEVKEEEEEEQALDQRAGTKVNNKNRFKGTGTVSHARRARFQAAAMTREVRAMEHEDRLGREWQRKVFGTSLVQVKKEEKSLTLGAAPALAWMIAPLTKGSERRSNKWPPPQLVQ